MSPVAAECCGIPRPKHLIIAFAISAFYPAFPALCHGHLVGHLSTETFSLALSLSFLTMAVIGGLHSRAGALLGGAYLALAPELLREFKEAQMVIHGIPLLICVRSFPADCSASPSASIAKSGEPNDAVLRSIMGSRCRSRGCARLPTCHSPSTKAKLSG